MYTALIALAIGLAWMFVVLVFGSVTPFFVFVLIMLTLIYIDLSYFLP